MAFAQLSFNTAPVEDFYTLGDELGRGSFSVVRVAVEKATGKTWAAKIIDKDDAQQSKKLDMVNVEIAIMKRLGHPHVVQCKDVFDNEKSYVIVMEAISGGELFDQIVKLQHYTEQDASRVMYQLLGAIAHLHERDVIHRDLKPENLLLAADDPKADVKLTDFGLSVILETPTQLLTKAVGTPGYIAPETLRALEGSPGYGKSVDVWACGVIMYILLCGFPPFYEEDEEDLYDAILDGKYSFPAPYWNNISASAKDLINRLLVNNEHNRISAADALQHEWIKGAAPADNLADTIEQLKKFQAKRRWKKGILATLATKRFGARFAALKRSTGGTHVAAGGDAAAASSASSSTAAAAASSTSASSSASTAPKSS